MCYKTDVFRATIIAKLTYCSPAWSGLTSAQDRARIDAFLRRSKRYGYCADSVTLITHMFAEADQSLFRRILKNEFHVLHQLLPEKTNCTYNLRSRQHKIIQINNRLYSTPDTQQAGVQRHHTGMRGGVAPVGCQPQGPACRQPTANTAPVVHLSQPKLVPTLLLGGQGLCVNNLPKVVTRYASAGDRTRDLPIASRER